MDLYQQNINYTFLLQKTCIAHHKPTNKDEDQ